MLILVLALIVSFVPSVLMFLFLLNNRKDDEEYQKNCTKLFWKGVPISLLVCLMDLILTLVFSFSGLSEAPELLKDVFKCFVINATVEETCKFLVANKYIKADRERVSRLDVISYLTIAAISFGLVEDIVYMFSTNVGQIIVRGVLMGHVPYELFMGLFYGKGLAENNKGCKILAFVVPILFHGSYNLLLKESMPDWSAVVVITEVFIEVIFLVYMIFFIRKKRNDPQYTSPIFADAKE